MVVMTSTFRRALSLLALACLASAVQAESNPSAIRDDAGLFHSAAIARAEEHIGEIRTAFDHNLFVRTVESALPQQRRLFPFLSKHEAHRLLEEQASKYADELGRNGIYVVICKRPRGVHVIVRPEDDPDFTRHDAEALRRMLARRLADSSYDSALLDLVDHVQSLLQAHAEYASSPVANEVLFAGVLGGGLALWSLLGMIRFRMRRKQPATLSEEDAAMQARATPALLGAMFGFPAGMWIYDKLYPCPAGTPLPLCEPTSAPMTEQENIDGATAEDHPHEEHTEDAPVSP
jgi:uncharacterized membrane protein YgcG